MQHQLFNKIPLQKCQGACCRDDKTPEGLAEKAELLQRTCNPFNSLMRYLIVKNSKSGGDGFMSLIERGHLLAFGQGSHLLEDFPDPKLGELLYSDKQPS